MKGKPAKILHIVNIPWYSGLAGYAEDMADFSIKFGYEVLFAAVEGSPLMEKLQKKFKSLPLHGRGPADTLRSIKTIRKALDGVDMIFAHTGSSFFLAVGASLFKKVRVYRVRAERGRIKKNIFNIIMHKFAAGVVAPTIGIKKIFLDFGIPENKIYYLPPVVDSDIFYPQPLKSANTIGIVGRLDKVKGHEVLIESLPLVKEEIEDIKVIVIGDEKGVTEKDLIKKARKLGVAGSLRFMGKVKYETIPVIMGECRAGIIPSLGSEAVSRAALEWMAAGRPVIASRVGCLEEIIINNYNGFSVYPGDSEELGIRIIELLKVGEHNSQMAKKAEIYVRQHFTPEVYSKYLKKILDE
ncbi:MAG: glycosyltransferase family 4 protein [Elusimicrobiota bacterium]|nr:glycosyltransferase family 4 protein [Elusimicrobiota bacterium]